MVTACTTLYERTCLLLVDLQFFICVNGLLEFCSRHSSTAISHLPSGTEALFEEGFFPHYTFSVGSSSTCSTSSNLSAETLLGEGWCSTFFTYLMWQSIEDYKNFFFSTIKVLPRPLTSTSSFPKVNLSASLFIQKRTALQTCRCLEDELTLVLTYWVRKTVWHPTLIFLQSPRKRGWKQPHLLSWPTLLSTSGELHTFFYPNTPKSH